MLTHCCFCIPLRAGSIVIGVIFVLSALGAVLDDIQTLNHLGDDKDDDEENLEQKRHMRNLIYISLFSTVLQMVFGWFVIYAACRMTVALLKVCSIVLVIKAFFLFFFLFSHLHSFLTILLTSLVYLYFAWVLWSYAKELEDFNQPRVIVIPPPETFAMYPPRNGQRRQQDEPPSYGWASNPGNQGYHLYPVASSGPHSRSVTPSRYPGPPEVQQYPGPPSAPPEYSRNPPSSTSSRTHIQSSRTPEQPS